MLSCWVILLYGTEMDVLVSGLIRKLLQNLAKMSEIFITRDDMKNIGPIPLRTGEKSETPAARESLRLRNSQKENASGCR